MTHPILEVVSVSKRFGGLLAINEVSFSVGQGEIVGLIGPNGAGKTTLFEIASGYIRPTSGEVRYLGSPISHQPTHRLSRLGVGRTFQIVQPFLGLTVLENVMTGALGQAGRSIAEARTAATAVLQKIRLDHRAGILARNLTLPEKKRLELARALATQPKLLLLDEVMAGLTPAEVDDILPILHEIRESGVTLLVVEHIMRAIMSLSDRLVVIANGRKIAEGRPEDVARDEAVISAYLGRKKAS